jgi:iron complex outermembrane recepter protein
LTQNLSLNTGFIYAKTTYESDVPVLGKSLDGGPVDMRGKQVAYAPRYKFTLSGEYEHSLGEALDGFLGVDTVWKSRIRYQQSLQEDETFGSHWIVGGRIGVRGSDDRFTAALFVRNLFNVHEPVTLQQPLANAYRNATAAIYGPNGFRQVGLSLDMRF